MSDSVPPETQAQIDRIIAYAYRRAEIEGVMGLICAVKAWRSLLDQDAVWELVWQVKEALGSGVPPEDVYHDLVELFR